MLLPYGIRYPGTQALRGHMQAVPARRARRVEGVPCPIHRGQLSVVRGAAPVPAFRGVPGPSESPGGEAGKG